MANHKSTIQRMRQNETRRLHNRYYAKTMRNALRKLRATTDKEAATEMYPKVQKMLDKLAHQNEGQLLSREQASEPVCGKTEGCAQGGQQPASEQREQKISFNIPDRAKIAFCAVGYTPLLTPNLLGGEPLCA